MVFYRCRRPGSFENRSGDGRSTPPVSSPSRGGAGICASIRAFPLDGERLDRGETLWNAFNFHLLWTSVRS